MTTRTKYVVGGVAAVLFGWWILPNWLAGLLLVAVVAVPVVGYLMLDPSQRKRIGMLRGREQVGR